MTAPTIIREWASNAAHSISSDPTKVDPGAAISADGFTPDEEPGAEHFNHLLNQVTRNANWSYLSGLLTFAPVADLYGTPSDAHVSAASTDMGEILTVNGDKVASHVTRGDRMYQVSADAVSPTPDAIVRDLAARDDLEQHVIAVHWSGGSNAEGRYSTDGGTTWTNLPGSSGIADLNAVVYDDVNENWIGVARVQAGNLRASYSASNEAFSDWTAAETGRTEEHNLLAVYGGLAVAVGRVDNSNVWMTYSTDGGINWTSSTEAIANSDVVGLSVDASGLFYLVIKDDGTGVIRVHTSTTGTAWALKATLTGTHSSYYKGVASVGNVTAIAHTGDAATKTPSGLYATWDAGATWTLIPLDPTGNAIQINATSDRFVAYNVNQHKMYVSKLAIIA